MKNRTIQVRINLELKAELDDNGEIDEIALKESVDVFAQELTSANGKLRHCTFHRFRKDVNAKDCTFEKLKKDFKQDVRKDRTK